MMRTGCWVSSGRRSGSRLGRAHVEPAGVDGHHLEPGRLAETGTAKDAEPGLTCPGTDLQVRVADRLADGRQGLLADFLQLATGGLAVGVALVAELANEFGDPFGVGRQFGPAGRNAHARRDNEEGEPKAAGMNDWPCLASGPEGASGIRVAGPSGGRNGGNETNPANEIRRNTGIADRNTFRSQEVAPP